MQTIMQVIKRSVGEVLRNEDGMEELQSVVITGISALVLAGMYQWRSAIFAWVHSILAVAFKIAT